MIGNGAQYCDTGAGVATVQCFCILYSTGELQADDSDLFTRNIKLKNDVLVL